MTLHLRKIVPTTKVHSASRGSLDIFSGRITVSRSIWADMLKQYRTRAGLTKTRLAKSLSVTISYISKLESGQKPPTESQRESLCEAMNLSEDESLAFHVQAEIERTDPIAVKYLTQRDTTSHCKSTIREASIECNESAISVASAIPIINKVAAGYPQEFTDLDYPVGVAEQYVSLPDVSDPNAFAFYVFGDSMEPEFESGSLMIASPNSAAFDGDACFVRFSPTSPVAGCTFKRVYFMTDGRVRLVPANQKYAEQYYSHDDISGIWPVTRQCRQVSRHIEKGVTRRPHGRASEAQTKARTSAAVG